MRNLWRALALAWLGGVASPGLADDVLQSETVPEIAAESGQPDDVEGAVGRVAAAASASDAEAER
jgi:hypothetical protein